MPRDQTDFNDLHVSVGLPEVRRQLFVALDSANDSAAAMREDSMAPPAPPLLDRPDLDKTLER
ncbi:MAG: hypothetical protein ACI93R_003278, partial [Flavobacteriales bacterium]